LHVTHSAISQALDIEQSQVIKNASGTRSSVSYAFVLVVGLAEGALSGVVGTGSTIVLLPVLVFQFGPKQAVPIMAIAALLANVAKVMAWWREIDWRAFAAYSIPGVPAFQHVLDAMLFCAGLSLLWGAFA
jgi:hypothetical protein